MTSWLRLWHDMPTDPKFRTISKVSKQPLCAVLAMYTFLLVDASNATERGRTHANDEDVASAIDLEINQVRVIREAMQGRVLDGNYLTGWEKRQPKREDNSSERSKTWREEQKNRKETERNRTQPNAEKRPDTDTDTDTDIKPMSEPSVQTSVCSKNELPNFEQFWKAYPRDEKKKTAREVWKRKNLDSKTEMIIADVEKRKLTHGPWLEGFIPHASTYLNQERWGDKINSHGNSKRISVMSHAKTMHEMILENSGVVK